MSSYLLDSPMTPDDEMSPGYSRVDVDEHFSAAAGNRASKLSHSLARHEQFTLNGLARLCSLLPPTSIKCLDENRLPVEPGESASCRMDYSGIVLNIGENRNWLVMRNIEQDAAFESILDSVLHALEPWLPEEEGRLTRREGNIHLLAPEAETPAHIAPEHNLLMQISGSTQVFIAPFADRRTQLKEIERFCDSGLRYLSNVPPLVRSFRLHAGQALYLPPWLPRWVSNDNRTSVSLSVKFRTENSERFESANIVNSELRSLGLTPTEAGQSQFVDMTKSSYLTIKRRIQEFVN